MTYRHGVDGVAGAGEEAVELLWTALNVEAPESSDVPEPETTALSADVEPEPEIAAPPAVEARPATDEWDDLRQVLAGDDPAPAPEDDADDDEIDDEIDDEEDAEPLTGSVAEALAERVEQLAAELDEERAERVRLAAHLDRLASELDAVLGEALATEQERREQIEETLRQVQQTLSDSAPVPYDGPERRVAGERRRSGARRERPLRARDFTPAPVDDEAEADAELEAADPSAWKGRLHDVAGSVSAWTSEDVDRLRVD